MYLAFFVRTFLNLGGSDKAMYFNEKRAIGIGFNLDHISSVGFGDFLLYLIRCQIDTTETASACKNNNI